MRCVIASFKSIPNCPTTPFNLFGKSTMGSTVPLNLINILHEFEALVPFAIPVALGTLSLLFLYFIKGLIFAQKKGYAKLPPVLGTCY